MCQQERNQASNEEFVALETQADVTCHRQQKSRTEQSPLNARNEGSGNDRQAQRRNGLDGKVSLEWELMDEGQVSNGAEGEEDFEDEELHAFGVEMEQYKEKDRCALCGWVDSGFFGTRQGFRSGFGMPFFEILNLNREFNFLDSSNSSAL